MDLPNEIRNQIAERIVRIAAPVIIVASILVTFIILIFFPSEHLRLLPILVVLPSMTIAWLATIKGRPLIGFLILILLLSLTIMVGMYFNGGVKAPIFTCILVLVTIITVLYGLKGGILFAIASIVTGGFFAWFKYKGVLPKSDNPTDKLMLIFFLLYIIIQLFIVQVPARLTFRALLKSKKRGEELKKAVSDRKNAQKELQSILNNTPDIIYRLDLNGKFTFINDEIRKYGIDPVNIIGENFLDLVHMDDRENTEKILFNKISDDPLTDFEVRLLIKKIENDKDKLRENNWSTFLISGFQIFSDSVETRKCIGSQGIARDISESKHYESQLIRLAAVVEQAGEDVIITDSAGIIQYVNPEFENLTGYTKEEVIGKKPSFLKSGKHDKTFYTDLWNTIQSGKIWNGQMWNRTKSKDLILQDVSIMPILDKEEITGYASVRRDITEKDKLEDRLRQSQKMEAIGLLAGGIAHDFNNILSAIIGFSELILRELNKENPHTAYVDQIHTAGHRAKDLVSQILLFSRQTEHRMVPVKISSLAKEVIKLLEATLPSSIDIETEFSDKSIMVLADSTQIHQIFMNICTNATHAMGDKGTLKIKMTGFKYDEDSIGSVPRLKTGNYLKIEISDTGHGIPQDIIKKVFDPFFTTKSRDEGTGMGLSVVHGIVLNHGGEIAVYSEDGVGTTFNIYLPVIENKEQYKANSKNTIPKGDGHILFVDDETSLVEIGKKMLGMLGYKVTGITDSVEAWEMFQNDPKRFDLVITDKSMPEISGLELSEKILSTNPDIPIILCTGYSEQLTKEQAMDIGINAVLNKPMILKDIADAINGVMKT